MQILSVAQIKQWDAYTIANEPISEINLMERAAHQCVQWLQQNNLTHLPFHIFCGRGNNGGDGLAIARLLIQLNYEVTIYIIDASKSSAAFENHLSKLISTGSDIHFIHPENEPPVIEEEAIIIEALWGIGLSRKLSAHHNQFIAALNQYPHPIVSIDIPAGMFADGIPSGNNIIKASYTLSFECFKIAFLLPSYAPFLGALHILNIGLDASFTPDPHSPFQFIDPLLINDIYKPRHPFSHKGNHGHALIVAGSYGKMGAAVLASKAAVYTGAGLTSALIPSCGYEILQTAIPEAMVIVSASPDHLSMPTMDPTIYTAIGIGPGIGKHTSTLALLEFFLQQPQPVLLDADALNLVSENPFLLNLLPPQTIITPHPKEFDRLFGGSENEWERIQKAITKANQYQIMIVLKGHYTMIFTPGRLIYCNTTGNAGLAKGGSGDVLSGMITALLAQKYTALESAILGVYLHGLAADKAVTTKGVESLTATDTLNNIGTAFLSVQMNLSNPPK